MATKSAHIKLSTEEQALVRRVAAAVGVRKSDVFRMGLREMAKLRGVK